jgi:hypothetical protein
MSVPALEHPQSEEPVTLPERHTHPSLSSGFAVLVFSHQADPPNSFYQM